MLFDVDETLPGNLPEKPSGMLVLSGMVLPEDCLSDEEPVEDLLNPPPGNPAELSEGLLWL